MNDVFSFSVEQIIYGSYVKYDTLQYLVYRTFSNSSIATATQLNVFVDLYSVLKSVFSEHGHVDLSIGNYTDLTTCLVNLCAHYRSFFKTLGVHTRFFMVFSLNTGEYYTKFVKEYNELFYNKTQIKQFKDVVSSNFQLLDLICPYLPDIHFVYSGDNYETTVLIAYLINKVNDGNPNLIISRDIYPLQLCATFPNTSYLYPKKYHQEDRSIMVSINEKRDQFRKDFWDLYSAIRYSKSSGKISPDTMSKLYNLSPLNYPLLLAMNIFKERNLYSVLNIDQAINCIYDVAGTEDIKLTIDSLKLSGKINDELASRIEPRFHCLDYSYAYPYYANSTDVIKINLNNLQDNGKLENINSKYFSNNPMKLMYL